MLNFDNDELTFAKQCMWAVKNVAHNETKVGIRDLVT